MTYQGLINKSRTLDALAVLALLNAMYPPIMDLLEKTADPVEIAWFNVAYTALLAVLRYKTRGPVGDK